jgi:hypothetical protein
MNRLRDTDANYDENYIGLQLRSSWPFRSTQLFVCSALDAREAVPHCSIGRRRDSACCIHKRIIQVIGY